MVIQGMITGRPTNVGSCMSCTSHNIFCCLFFVAFSIFAIAVGSETSLNHKPHLYRMPELLYHSQTVII